MKCDKKLLFNTYIKSTHKREYRIEPCLWDFGQNLILGDFWQIRRIINWYLVLIKEEEEEEFEEVTHDWIRLASLNQAKKEFCPHWQIIFHHRHPKSLLEANIMNFVDFFVWLFPFENLSIFLALSTCPKENH